MYIPSVTFSSVLVVSMLVPCALVAPPSGQKSICGEPNLSGAPSGQTQVAPPSGQTQVVP